MTVIINQSPRRKQRGVFSQFAAESGGFSSTQQAAGNLPAEIKTGERTIPSTLAYSSSGAISSA
jgi:hypothetical protein